MTDQAEALLRQVLSLPAEERAGIAAELLASLEPPDNEDFVEVQAAWATEIERRARRVLAGESDGEPWEHVRERVAQRLSQG